jgi:hypothetical protein
VLGITEVHRGPSGVLTVADSVAGAGLDGLVSGIARSIDSLESLTKQLILSHSGAIDLGLAEQIKKAPHGQTSRKTGFPVSSVGLDGL